MTIRIRVEGSIEGDWYRYFDEGFLFHEGHDGPTPAFRLLAERLTGQSIESVEVEMDG
jgi:hypothetical protein